MQEQRKRLWTPEMENELVELNSRGNMSDREIGERLGGLTKQQIYYKKRTLLSANGKKTTRRKRFTPEEDEALTKYCMTYCREDGSIIWGYKINDYLPGRNIRQCRDRWLNYLSPDVNISKPWTPEEDVIILKAVEKSGPINKTFSILRKQLDRSANSIRNHYLKKLAQVLHPDGVVALRRQRQTEILNNVNNDIDYNILGNEQNQIEILNNVNNDIDYNILGNEQSQDDQIQNNAKILLPPISTFF